MRETISSPVPASNSPYSDNLSFLRTAICRTATLCAWEPVKYCSAAPQASSGTTRRSACSPAAVRMEVLVGPLTITPATSGWVMKAAISGAESSAAARMSTSPIVSRHPPQRARVGAALAARDRGQRRHHGRRRAHGHVEQDPLAALPVYLDSARQPLLAPGPEPGQPVQPARLDRRGELVHRRDAQVVVELHGAFRPEAGHPGQLQHPGRDPGPQLVQRGDPPGRGVLGDLGGDRGAHPGDGPQALGVELADILAPAADRPGGLLVVPGPEHVAAGDLDQLGVLAQQPRDFLVEPGHGLTLGERLAAVIGAPCRLVPWTRSTGAPRSAPSSSR